MATTKSSQEGQKRSPLKPPKSQLQERLKVYGVALNKRYTENDLENVGKEVLAAQGLHSYFEHCLERWKRKRTQELPNPFSLYSKHEHYLGQPEIKSRIEFTHDTKKTARAKVEIPKEHEEHKDYVFTTLMSRLRRNLQGFWEPLKAMTLDTGDMPITHKRFLAIKKDIAFTKVLTIQRTRNIQSIQEEYRNENLDLITQELEYIRESRKFENYLDALASAAHKAMTIAADETNKSMNKQRTIMALIKASQGLRQSLIKLDEKFARYKVYQSYIDEAQKSLPRKQQENALETESLEEDTDKYQESAMERVATGDTTSLTEIFIQTYISGKDTKAVLLFRDPQEFLDVLSEIETLNLMMFEYSQDLRENIEQMKREADMSVHKLDREISSIKEQMKVIEDGIKWKQIRLEEIQQTLVMYSEMENKILGQEKAIENFAEKVERIYETISDEIEGDLTEVEILRKIETKFVDLAIELDSLPESTVRSKLNQLNMQEMKKRKKDKEFAANSKKAEAIATCLARAMLPSHKRPGRKLYPRSQIVDKKILPRKPKEQYTEEELQEHLYFFT